MTDSIYSCMLVFFYASAHGISLKKRKDIMNIDEIRNAMDVIKPLLNARQVKEFNNMISKAIDAYHVGMTDDNINSDLNTLGIVKSEDIFDSPF